MNKFFLELLRNLYYFKYFIFFKRKGKNISLSKGGLINVPNNVELGSNIYIGRDFKINANGGLEILNNVMIGPNLLVETDDHCFDKIGIQMFTYSEEKICGKVIIESDVWIGGNVTILKGVKIGEGAIVGACSLITKDVQPYTISVGIPCRKIKTRFSREDLERHLQIISSKYTINDLDYIYK